MKQKNGILVAIATFLFRKNPKMRWIVPLLPLTLAAYRKYVARSDMGEPRMRRPARA